jgi:hypothetical protein
VIYKVRYNNISNKLVLIFIKFFKNNKLYKGLSFKIKELYNINNISYINKYKAICFKVNKGN